MTQKRLTVRRLAVAPRSEARPPVRGEAKAYNHYDPMSDMEPGRYVLSRENVRKHVPQEYGIYLILARCSCDEFIVLYTGRSGILASRLTQHIRRYGGAHFAFKRAYSEEDSYAFECEEYNRYGGKRCLDNRMNPALPAGSTMPRCRSIACGTGADTCDESATNSRAGLRAAAARRRRSS